VFESDHLRPRKSVIVDGKPAHQNGLRPNASTVPISLASTINI